MHGVIAEASLLLETLLKIRFRGQMLKAEREISQDPGEIWEEVFKILACLILTFELDLICQE